jgi:hypothetical protein
VTYSSGSGGGLDTSRDVRELILDRIKDILTTLKEDGTFVRVYRNTNEIPEDARPAAVLIDGPEVAKESDPNNSGMAPRSITAMPQIAVLEDSHPEDLGTTLNLLRRHVIYAIQSDNELRDLSLNGNGVVYTGCEPIIANGRLLEGTLVLTFAIPYLLRISDLA